MTFGAAMLRSLALGLAMRAFVLPGGAQELASSTRSDSATVGADEDCAKQGFEVVRGGAGELIEERSGRALCDAGRARRQFIEADRDGDGRISRDEWMRWRERAFAGAAKGVAGGMAAPARQAWQSGP